MKSEFKTNLVLPRIIFSFSHIETDDDESEDYSIPDGQMQKLVL